MNHAINVWMFREYFIKSCLIGNIEIIEIRFLSTDEFDTIENFGGRIVQVVRNDNLIACFKQGQCCERTNISGSTTKLISSFLFFFFFFLLLFSSSFLPFYPLAQSRQKRKGEGNLAYIYVISMQCVSLLTQLQAPNQRPSLINIFFFKKETPQSTGWYHKQGFPE
jgi:hypothetical protein